MSSALNTKKSRADFSATAKMLLLFTWAIELIVGLIKAIQAIVRWIPKLRNILLAVTIGMLLALGGFLWSLDPDRNRDTCQLILARGFPCEIHPITTYQGYIIDLHRIPTPGGQPVLLQTGLLGTSADFIMATDQVSFDKRIIGQNMGLELAKQGYDVWLSNNRGSRYSRRHTNWTVEDERFWRFSFDEISQFDVPAIIDEVLKRTGFDKLHYIGHSQGSAVMFALLSQTAKYNNKLASFTAISPVTRIGDAATSFRLLIKALKPILYSGGEVFGSHFLTDSFLLFASELPFIKDVFEFAFFSITGPDYEQLDKSRLGVYSSHMPTSTSAQNLLHFDQLFTTNRFTKFDHGPLRNNHFYGQPTPPDYNLTAITAHHIHIIYSDNDWFVPLSGVAALQADLNQTDAQFYLISNPNTNHMDPLIGKTVAPEVNRMVLNILSRSRGNFQKR